MFSEYNRDIKWVIKYISQLFELAEVEPRSSIRNMLLENRRNQSASNRNKKHFYPTLKYERRSNGYCYYNIQEVDLWTRAVIQQNLLWQIDDNKKQPKEKTK